MTTPLRAALSALAVSTVLAGCAGPGSRQPQSASADGSRIGLATRAQAALMSGNGAAAVDLAEQAVAGKPDNAQFRALLGSSYMAAGRFASAEAAFRDSLSLDPSDSSVAMKLALSLVAEGKKDQALGLLDQLRSSGDAADVGLAMALAGQPGNAVAVLQEAAAQPGADARVRQNLALAHGLAGDWAQARVVAAQDLPAAALDSRLQQWMGFAHPATTASQVASLIGVTPAASDPGQPVRLALTQPASPVRLAQAAPVAAAPADVAAPVAVTDNSTVLPLPAPAAVAAAAPMPDIATAAPRAIAPAPVVQAAAEPYVQVRKLGRAFRPASYTPKGALLRPAVMPRLSPQGGAVVQLGAYGSPDRVAAAWNAAARRYPSLKRYQPASARFSGPRGTVYRLSLSGFPSEGAALRLCGSLRSAGGSCFVRRVAGDAPVQMASR
ncbi:SPOR domain-containing protein [Sphingomonas ginkgonis]|uniref:SPOR domain-containing protein n=1 Tax=Sphingomonas ginkgonis TaxID=2315330 RepID=A0A429VBF5_9SPHN|nr:SPOR domain-containing protein [Sphingomonas ginkgonis]RST31177.1 SPOR domain-containing protein [Sphingomonas ginkgonis]